MSPICSGVRGSVQPFTLQQRPIVTDALSICSQVKPVGHWAAFGSHKIRAVGMLGLSVHAAPSVSDATTADQTTARRAC
jgi:hypothetical protein